MPLNSTPKLLVSFRNEYKAQFHMLAKINKFSSDITSFIVAGWDSFCTNQQA